ncbi:MAG: AAA family ATPase [bacterium]
MTIFAQLLADLATNQIPYVLLRDKPDAPSIHDLDLLIDETKSDEFLALCRQHGFRLIRNGRLNPGKLLLLRWQNEGPLLLDVHQRLVVRGVEYLDAQRVLARRRADGGFFFPGREDHFLTLLFHNILGKGEIQAKHREQLAALLSEPLNERYLAQHTADFGLQKTLTAVRQRFDELQQKPELVRRLNAASYRQIYRQRPVYWLRRQALQIKAWLQKWWGAPRGVLIVLLGPDGCGKSTLIQKLRERLRAAALTTDTVYLGPWGQSVLPLQKLLSRFNITPYRAEDKAFYSGKAAKREVPRGWAMWKQNAKAWLYYLAVAIELWYRYRKLVLPRLRQGRVVLADRYIYDLLVGYKSRPMDYHWGIRRWLCRRFSRPHLTLLLDAPPEVIHRRKPQFSTENLAAIRAAYADFAGEYDLKILDTSVSVEKTLADFQQNYLNRILDQVEKYAETKG